VDGAADAAAEPASTIIESAAAAHGETLDAEALESLAGELEQPRRRRLIN